MSISENGPELWSEVPYPAPPERLPPVPRGVAWNTRARWLRTGVVAGLLFAPNALLVWGWDSGKDLRELAARGETITGKVVEKTFYLSRGGTVHKVDYSFEVRGRDYRDTANVSPEEFPTYSRGGPFRVTYLKDQPATHCPGHPGPLLQRHNENFVYYALVAAAIFGAALGWVEFRLRRERFLAREGEPAVGRVTERGTTRTKNRTLYWVSHAFTAPDGEPLTGWHYVTSPIYEQLRPSARVTLLFDPARPQRHLPLYAFEYAYIVEDQAIEGVEGENADEVESNPAEEQFS